MKGRITKTGYRRNSPDVNNDFNIIPSNRISMKGVDFPVFGVDNMGNSQMMYPGGEYEYQGDYVTELPAYGSGGLTQWFAEKWVDIKTGKKCGRSGKDKKGRPYPACRPSKRVNSTTPKTKGEMSASEKAKFKRKKKSGKRIDYNHKRAQFGGRSGDLFQEVDTYIKPGQNIRPNWAQTPDMVTNYTIGKNLIDDEPRFSLGLQGTDIFDEIKYRADAIGSIGVGLGNRKGKGFRPAGENLRAGLRGQASWQGVPGNVIENMFGRRSGLDWRGSVEGEAGVSYANGAVRPYMSIMPQTNVFLNDNLSLGIGYEMRGRYDKNFNQPLSGNTDTGTRAPVSQRDAYSGMGRGAGRFSLNYDLGNGDFIEGYYAKPNTLYQGSMPGIPQVMALESEGPRFGVRLRKSFQPGGENDKPLTSNEIYNIPRTVRYENGKMVLQDKPIYDGMLNEVTVTPYSAPMYFWQDRTLATGGLEPTYPIFDVMTLGLKTPATAGAKAVQAGIKNAPSKINPRYFKPAEDLWYRQVGKSAIDDIAESKVIRERGEDILNSQRVYNDRVLRMKGIDPDTGKPFANYEIAAGQQLLGSRRPKSPYFQKGELYWGWNRKPGKGKPGRGGDADSEYLIESLLDDRAFHPAHVKGMFPDTPDKWVGDIGILKPRPELRDPLNFNIYKRNWWSGYKPIKAYGGSLYKAQEGIEVPLTSNEVFNIPRTVRYENSKMVLQDKPIWDGMLDEVTITPTTASEYAWEENRSNQSTGGLEPVYPIFDLMSSGLRAPLTKGAKAVQSTLASEKTLGALARSRYVPKFTKPGLIKNYKSKFPNVDLRGTGSGNYSKLGVNELGLGVDDFGSLTNYERSAISQVNQTQPADEVFNTFVQRYADFNTDDALANQLADFSRRNPRTKFEMNLGRDVTPSKRMQEIFNDPELNVHNVFSYESSGPMTFKNKWGSESRRFYDSSARNAAGEFEKNLRSYGQQGFYAANVPMGKPVKQALTYNKNGRVFDYVTETLPVSDFVVNKGLMNPDVIGNFSRYRGAGDMANQHNFLLGITNNPSVIISGNKGFAGLKEGNKIREKIGGLITPAGGKAVPSHNKQVVPLLKQEFDLSKPFEGTFIKSPSILETYYNSRGQASPYTNFPGVLDIDNLFTTGKSNLAKGGQLPKAQDGIEVIGRNGVRKNSDGSVSTHLMAREYVDGRGWVAFPTLFQNSDSSWVDMSQDSNWYPAYEEAVKRGEVYDFGENVEAAINFSDKGSWKKQEGGQQGPPYMTEGPVSELIYPSEAQGPQDVLTENIKRTGRLGVTSKPVTPSVDVDRLRKGIKYAESLGGKLMMNPESSATGFYGQLFSEIDGKDFLQGVTRQDFANDTTLQNKVFDERLGGNEGLFGKKTGLVQDGMDLYNEYKPELGDKLTYTPTELAALSNMLGRQGTREYLGYVLRDGKTLAEALPKIYGPKAKYKNKTPDQYIAKFNEAFGEGGESIPVYNTYNSKNRAWLAARKNLGAGKKFMYGGKVYSTNTPKGL